MIVAYAGRRPGSEDFPDAHVTEVGERIEQLLTALAPRRLIGSAAAGADLLVLEAAERKGIEAETIVVGDVDAFRDSSVADKGADWIGRYEHQMRRVPPQTLAPAAKPEEGYRAVTDRIAERAKELLEDGEALVILAVSKPRDEGTDETEELARHGNAPGRLVLRIDTSRPVDAQPRAFVAMPFGTKPYPERGWQKFDADLSYQRIMVPALISSGYRPVRADTDALLEIIDHTMLREINGAPLMIVDLAMLNANVMWELGLRHAWRRAGTIVMAPDWVTPPFDVKRVPVLSYRRMVRKIKDADAVDAIEALRKAIAAVPERRVDSPVFANINALKDVEIPDPAPSADAAGELLETATRAGDREDAAELLRTADRIRDAGELRDVQRVALLEQIGLRLVALDHYRSALDVLGPLVHGDTGLDRRRLQEQYAHTLIRVEDDEGKEDRLAAAVVILQGLRRRYGDSGESLGLLGSAAKVVVEDAAAEGGPPPPGPLAAAIDAYRAGMEAEPADAYPGINAVALLRLRGQRWAGPESDLDEARRLLPVVRFAATRPGADEDVWSRLTVAECHLHDHLLDGDRAALEAAHTAYAAAVGGVARNQRRSASRQLRLMRNAGDPPDVLDPLLALFA